MGDREAKTQNNLRPAGKATLWQTLNIPRVITKDKVNLLPGKCVELKGPLPRDYQLVRGWWERDRVDEASGSVYLHTEGSGPEGVAEWKELLLCWGYTGDAALHLISEPLISKSDVVLNNSLDQTGPLHFQWNMGKLGVKILVQKLRNWVLLPDLAQILCIVYGMSYIRFISFCKWALVMFSYFRDV